MRTIEEVNKEYTTKCAELGDLEVKRAMLAHNIKIVEQDKVKVMQEIAKIDQEAAKIKQPVEGDKSE